MLQKHIFLNGDEMYFDAILDGRMNVLFNATPEECKDWLSEHTTGPDVRVCVGKTMELLTVNEYLRYPSQK